MLIFQFGIKGNIKKTFSQTDIKYIEKHITEHTVLTLNNKSMTLNKKQTLLWIEFLMRDGSIIETKTRKNKKTHACDVIIRFNNGSFIETATISFEYYKGKVTKIYG